MHRGSSKGPDGPTAGPELLPLSASPPLSFEVELRRGQGVDRRTVGLPPGSSVRMLLHRLGQPAEGSAVWVDGAPVPLDARLDADAHVLVVSTFSGG